MKSLNKDAKHLLIVDDDVRIRTLLQKYLVGQGYFVSIAKDAAQAFLLLQEIDCSLIILDVMMPGETGVEFAKRLRSRHNNILIIMLTAMGEVDSRINGLESGADDYVVKPFEPRELLLRINNMIKRQQEDVDIYYFGEFVYNSRKQSLSRNNELVFLTHSEYCLLDCLLRKSSEIVSRDELAKELNINERSVDVKIIRLRNKIELNPSRPQFLQTIRGQGYTLRIN